MHNETVHDGGKSTSDDRGQMTVLISPAQMYSSSAKICSALSNCPNLTS